MSRNIILVTVDSLRADHCGFMGASRDLTPTLDTLAADSLVFERAFAPGPRTPSSMPVIFTGQFFRPSELGVYADWEQKSSRWRARRERIGRHLGRFRTIPERLREHGYDTAAVTANPWTTPDTNFDRGFDTFRAVTEGRSIESWYSSLVSKVSDVLDVEWNSLLLTWTDFYDAVETARDALGEPYFLWVFLLDPHQPYVAPLHYRTETSALGMLYGNVRYNYRHTYTEQLPSHLDSLLRQAYRDTVRSVDGFVNRLHEDVASEDPVLAVHADHGEAFREHGTYGHRPQLYRENLHVPFFVHGVGGDRRVDAPVSLRRLPGILASVAQNGSVDPERFTREFVLCKTEECERVGLRSREWSYISGADGWQYVYDSDSTELYRLTSDPGEATNLARMHPEAMAVLKRLVDRHKAGQRERERIGTAVTEVIAGGQSNCER